MKSLMQCALGDDWEKLPPALQAHYRHGTTIEVGQLTVEYPYFMQPLLAVLRLFGALVDRGGKDLPTIVEKNVVGSRQYWRRTINYPDGKVIRFNSFWVPAEDGQLIEFVNSVLGLQMVPFVQEGKLCYRGVRYVARLGSRLLPIPEWLALGHTVISESAIDDTRFAMDFRLRHPLFGEVFRYSGEFETACK
jgi:hypothetical protein